MRQCEPFPRDIPWRPQRACEPAAHTLVGLAQVTVTLRLTDHNQEEEQDNQESQVVAFHGHRGNQVEGHQESLEEHQESLEGEDRHDRNCLEEHRGNREEVGAYRGLQIIKKQ